MAENKGFQFPDEVDDSDANDKIDDLEIELVDDTPDSDKDKEPLPKEVKEDLYNDELEDYSTKVKNKLLKMKKLAHDERREKEAALREQNEAIALAQAVMEENKTLKNRINDTEKNTLASIQRAVELEMEAAERKYRDAFESGDTEKIMEAQKQLNAASIKQDKVKNFRPAPLQIDTPVVKTNHQVAQQPQVDPTAVDWQSRNSWFGEDEEMTALALASHEKLKKEGVAVSSQEYYRRIDESVRKRFPEKFESDTEDDQKPEKATKQSVVVAPATRSTAPKKLRLTTSQMSIAKKLGLTPEQYAQAVLKMDA